MHLEVGEGVEICGEEGAICINRQTTRWEIIKTCRKFQSSADQVLKSCFPYLFSLLFIVFLFIYSFLYLFLYIYLLPIFVFFNQKFNCFQKSQSFLSLFQSNNYVKNLSYFPLKKKTLKMINTDNLLFKYITTYAFV